MTLPFAKGRVKEETLKSKRVMKKILITITLAFMSLLILGQSKGLYLTLGGSLGANEYRYELDNGSQSRPLFGYGGVVGVQYYFTRHWGLGTGVGLTYYHSQGKYWNNYQENPEQYSFEHMTDGDVNPQSAFSDYTLRLGLSQWKERQEGYFLEIPLLLMYQTKWGKSQQWGLYFGVGGKFQLPVFGEGYEVEEGSELSVKGYSNKYELEYPISGAGDLSRYGFGTNDELSYEGDLNVKYGFALSTELGILKSLSRRVDLTLGAYFDYGLSNIKDGNKSEGGYLLQPENGNTIHPNGPTVDYVGEYMQYNGYINSSATDKVGLMALGGKIGLRIKLGKLPALPQEEDPAPAPKKSGPDTVYVINMPPHDTTPRREYILQPQPEVNKGDVMEEDLRILFEPIFFDLDKDVLLPASIETLDRKIRILRKYPHMQLLITGNTCDLGTGDHNVKLGQRRASAAKKYLEDHGISRGRLSTVSQSFTHPMMPNTSEENREKNRRCDFYPTGY